MLRLINLYCSSCLKTRRFLDLGTHLICEVCSKRLERVRPGGSGKAGESVEQETPRRQAS